MAQFRKFLYKNFFRNPIFSQSLETGGFFLSKTLLMSVCESFVKSFVFSKILFSRIHTLIIFREHLFKCVCENKLSFLNFFREHKLSRTPNFSVCEILYTSVFAIIYLSRTQLVDYFEITQNWVFAKLSVFRECLKLSFRNQGFICVLKIVISKFLRSWTVVISKNMLLCCYY